jgi:fructose-1,6-bisphosphatase
VNRQVQVRKRKDLKHFSRYLEVECWKRAELRGLEPVLQAVADACKQINRVVQRAQTDDIYGAAVDAQGNPLDGTNIQGEVQQKLDVLCNTIMMRAFCGSSQIISGVASEEEDEPRCCADVMVRAKAIGDYFSVCFFAIRMCLLTFVRFLYPLTE